MRFVSEKVVASEDMFFHVRYLKLAENVGFIPEYFYNYFQNECSITHTYTEDKIERLKRFIQEIIQYLQSILQKRIIGLGYNAKLCIIYVILFILNIKL